MCNRFDIFVRDPEGTHMLRRLLNFAGVIACVFLITQIPLAAQVDTTPPVLTTFSFTPTTIDTTSGPATVTVNLSGTDDLSGIRYISVAFRSPSGTQWRSFPVGCTTGNTTCTASADITFPPYGEAGIWTVYAVQAYDASGNTTAYYTADLVAMGLPTQLTVASNQDVSPPVLTAFDFNPKEIDATSGPATVRATVGGTDDLSGISAIGVAFRSPSGTQWRSVPIGCTTGNTTCTASADIIFPQFGEAGIWTVSVVAYDASGNTTAYYTADLFAMGLPTQLTVASNQDVSPSVLTAFDFNPKVIDATSGPATVRATFGGTDDLSGIRYFSVTFQSPSGTQSRSVPVGCTTLSTTCTASADIIFPQFGEAGIWTVYGVQATDAVGNWKAYSTADLAAMGLPTKLLITPQVVPELVFINAGVVSAISKGKWSTVILQALVQNIGNLPASKVQVGFAYSIDGGLTFSNIGASKAATLAPGAAGIAAYSWKTQPGEYLIRVTIDPDNRVAEFDEANNSRDFPLTVR
jgi:hypothetical protein